MKRILIIAHKKKQLKVYMVWLDMLQLQQHAEDKSHQFGSRGRLQEGDMPPPARSAEAKISLKSKRCKRAN